MKGRWPAAWLGGMGLGLAAYGVGEAKRYRVNEYTVPVLPPGAAPVKVLQVSDLHLRPGNRSLIRFMESLADQTYDVVLATGDLLSGPDGLGECVRLLNDLKAAFGRYFVLGSSDYFAPTFKTYVEYFLDTRRHGTARNPTPELRESLTAAGWEDMTNRNLLTRWNGLSTQVTGLDDPYLGWDDRALLVRDRGAELGVCVVHDPAPYRQAAGAGYDLVVAGHTHGGQVRLPFFGAVVTNSTLPTRLARGLSKVNEGWLFVTPGLGVSKFAPFRFMCPPEASVLNLVAKDQAAYPPQRS